MKNFKRKKVIFFTSGNVGGAERVTLTIAKMLPREGYEPIIVHVCKKINNLDRFVPKWIPQLQIRINNIWDFTTIRIYRLIEKEKPYAVFCSLNYLNVRVILAAKLMNINKIIVRNNIGWGRWNRPIRLFARLTYPSATAVILQTKDMYEEFRSAVPEAAPLIHVIPNPLDTDYINSKLENVSTPYSQNYKNFVYVGRVSYEKGIDTLLKAFAKVNKQIPKTQLTIVGAYDKTSEYFQSLMNLLYAFGIKDKVSFIGFSDNPYRYIKYADCFVLASRVEGNPNVLHEAMYIRTPVVATRSIPIIDEIVTPERGSTVNVDDIDSLCSSMVNTLALKIEQPYNYSGGCTQFVKLFE